MALSTLPKNFTDGTVKVDDGTGTPLTRTLAFDRGTATVSGLRAKLNEVAAYERRGKLQGVRHTTRTYPTFSLTLYLTQWSDTGAGTLFDLIAGTSGTPYAARVSTLANSDVITFDVTLTIEGSNFNDDQDHELILNDVHLSFDMAEGDANEVTLNGTVYGAIGGDLAMAEIA